MFGHNKLFSKKVLGLSSRHAFFYMMGSFARIVSIIMNCIVLILLPASSLSQLLSTDALSSSHHVFEVHQDTRTEWNTGEFIVSANEDVAPYGQPEMTGGIYNRFYEGTLPYRTFGINRSLLLFMENRDSSRYPFGEIVFYTDRNLLYGNENTAYAVDWQDIQRQFVSFPSKTPSESTVYRVTTSLPYEQITYNRLHENLSESITTYTEPSEKQLAPRPSDIPVITMPGEEHSKYNLYKESELQDGGNVKLPLYVPWSRKGTDRSGLLPDTIYIGTDINYFDVADSLQSWKSGNESLQSDLNRLGSEWYDNRSGYIHFEWRIGK